MRDAPVLLVVEDEYLLHELIEDALGAEGFSVELVTSGEEAAVLLRRDGANYMALVTDIRISGHIDGWLLAKLARRSKPDLPVVYMTAHGSDWASNGVPHSILLPKPFAPAQLVAAVSRVLGKSLP